MLVRAAAALLAVIADALGETMRLSRDQVRFVEALFARLREELVESSAVRAVCEYDGGKDVAQTLEAADDCRS
jgi:hypothetical protein